MHHRSMYTTTAIFVINMCGAAQALDQMAEDSSVIKRIHPWMLKIHTSHRKAPRNTECLE